MIKVLVFDLRPQGGVGVKLASALRAIREVSLEVSEERVCSSIEKAPLQFAEALRTFRPSLAYFCWHSEFRPMASQLCQMFFQSSPNGSVLGAVVQTRNKHEIAELVREGVAHFLFTPIEPAQVLAQILQVVPRPVPGNSSIQNEKEKAGLADIVGEHPGFVKEILKIPKIAQTDATVLIRGETGTGKEVCARTIHQLSPRGSGPFVPFGCGNVPEGLLENELFGHEAGAYTGANHTAGGLVQAATGGTLLVDDIDLLPPGSQGKLLRILQEKEFKQLGSKMINKADLRIIATTNVNLEEAIRHKGFRQDLYYRLTCLELRIPPLRERGQDILLLAQYWLDFLSAKDGRTKIGISPAAQKKLLAYNWPGNMRQLQNMIQRAFTLSDGAAIQPSHILLPTRSPADHCRSLSELKNHYDSEEKALLKQCLEAADGNIALAAEAAKVKVRTFYRLLRRHQI